MAIVNRALDASEQKKTFSVAVGTVAAPIVTGATVQLLNVPFSSELRSVNVAAYGLSGAPTAQLKVHRFIAGAGATIIVGMGASMILRAFGTSGALQASLVASGSSLLQLLAGDQILVETGTANTSADHVVVGIVLKALQDIRADYGDQT